MTIPSAPQIGSTGFIQQPGVAEQIAPFLQLLMQKEELALRKERVKLEKQELESRLSQQAMEAQQQQALGGALLQALLGGETQTATIPQMPGLAVPPEGLPVQTLTPIGQAAQQLPLAAVPAFVEQTRDLRAEGRATRAVEQAIRTTVPAKHQAAAEALATFQLRGVDLPAGVQQVLYPDLFPQGVDPATMNAALRYGVAGGLKWGQIRSLFNLPPNAKVPDDFVFPVTLHRQQTEKQATAAMHYASMTRNGPIIDRLIAETGGISVPAHVYRTLQATQAASGGITGLVANLAGLGINWVLSPEQQQLVQAQFAFTNSYRYLVSGQQTSDREFIVIMNTISEAPGDSPEVKTQKRLFRQTMTESAGRLARGEATPGQVAENVLQQAQSLNLPADILEVLKRQQEDAKRFQATGQATPPFLSRDPADADSEAARRMILEMILRP